MSCLVGQRLVLLLTLLNRVSSSNFEESFSATPVEIIYQWSYINFTWESAAAYQTAINTRGYIPENVAVAGIKFYRNRFYIAMPKFRPGVPVTLAYFSTDETTPRTNPPFTPYPDWKTNTYPTCNNLEAIQSMEIDRNGVMWVLDGFRLHPTARCPTKLVLYDLNGNSQVRAFTFPEQISLSRGGFLNDIVVDDSDGGYAYITDNSVIDPGLVVYSLRLNRAWKLRDASMFPQMQAANFVVDDWRFSELAPIDGIALSPRGSGRDRVLFYCSLTGFSVYGISTELLKREDVFTQGQWRSWVTYLGDKLSQGDGMMMDNVGNLYYGLLPLYAVGRWNINQEISTQEVIYQNRSTVIWPDSFAFNNEGNMFVLANTILKFSDTNFRLVLNDEIKIRIFRFFTGTQSYLF